MPALLRMMLSLLVLLLELCHTSFNFQMVLDSMIFESCGLKFLVESQVLHAEGERCLQD